MVKLCFVKCQAYDMEIYLNSQHLKVSLDFCNNFWNKYLDDAPLELIWEMYAKSLVFTA